MKLRTKVESPKQDSPYGTRRATAAQDKSPSGASKVAKVSFRHSPTTPAPPSLTTGGPCSSALSPTSRVS